MKRPNWVSKNFHPRRFLSIDLETIPVIVIFVQTKISSLLVDNTAEVLSILI